MPTRRVLILDSNTDFADILRDGLELAGKFVVSVVPTGHMAVQAVRDNEVDLAIVDVAVSDISPGGLLEQLRELDPYIRIVFVPPFGQELEDTLAALDIQGVLHKPFFVGRLAEQIAAFLKKKVLTAPPTRVEQVCAQIPAIKPLLAEFSREISAEMVALICRDELVTYLGRSHETRENKLVQLILDSLERADMLAGLLGETDGHFDLHSFVGKTTSLYAIKFDRDLSIVAILGSGIPPGVVHLQIKRVVEELTALLHDHE
jgi:DNA-binding response OmpR family regulator